MQIVIIGYERALANYLMGYDHRYIGFLLILRIIAVYPLCSSQPGSICLTLDLSTPQSNIADETRDSMLHLHTSKHSSMIHVKAYIPRVFVIFVYHTATKALNQAPD